MSDNGINFEMNFPQVLFRLLNENKNHHIYGWNLDGKSFYIKDARTFNNKIVKEAFAISRSKDDFSTFLNFLLVARDWGFFYERGVNEDILEHPFFRRDSPHLLHQLKKKSGENQKRPALEGSSGLNRSYKKQKKIFANSVVSDSTVHDDFSGGAAMPHVPHSMVLSNPIGVTDVGSTFQDVIESEVASRLGRITGHVASLPQNSHHQPVIPMNDPSHGHPFASRSLLNDPLHRRRMLSSYRAESNASSIIGRSLHGPLEGRHPDHMADSLHGGLPRHLKDVHAQQLELQHRASMGYGTELGDLDHKELLRGIHNIPPRPRAGPFRRMPPPGRLSLPAQPQEERLLPGSLSLPLAERPVPRRFSLAQGERALSGRLSVPAQDERAPPLSFALESLKNKKKLEEQQREIDCMSTKVSAAIQIKEVRLEEMSNDKKFVDLPLMVSLLKNIQKDKDEVRRLDQEHLVIKSEFLREEIFLCSLEIQALKDLLSQAVGVQSSKKEVSTIMVQRAEALAMIPGPSRNDEKLHLERSMIDQRDEILASEQEMHGIQERIKMTTNKQESLKKQLKGNQGALTRMKAATIKIVKVEEEELQKRIQWEAAEMSANKGKALKSRRNQIKDLQREQEKLEKTLERRKVYAKNEEKLKKLSEKREKVEREAKAVKSVVQEETKPETEQNPESLEKQHALEEMVAAKMAVMMVRASRTQPVP